MSYSKDALSVAEYTPARKPVKRESTQTAVEIRMNFRTRAGGIVIGLCCVAAGVSMLAQQRAPLTPEQEARREWVRSRPMFPPDDAFTPIPLPPGEEKYARIKGAHVKELLKQVTAISRKSRDDGNQYWGRIPGTPYDKLTQRWIADQFTRVGLQQVRIQELDLEPQWTPTKWEATVSAGGKTVPLKTMFPLVGSKGTPDNGVDLDVVWVGLGTAADFAGRDVRGKAVIIHSIPTRTRLNHSAMWNGAIRRAQDLGAGLVIVVLGFPGNLTALPQAQIDPTTLAISVSTQESTMVREMIEKGLSPKIHVQLAVKTIPGLKTGNVWGVLPGMTDENILIMAHSDAFFEGALDNASGLGGMVALAEYFAALPKEQRRRTITFLSTPGHHHGRPGSRWVHEHRDTVLAKTALVLNCEHFSQTQAYQVSQDEMFSTGISARRWFVSGTDRLRQTVLKTFKDFGVAIYWQPEQNAGGELGEMDEDAPGVHIMDDTFYHTDLDVADLVPIPGLESGVRAYAKIVDEVNKMALRDVWPADRAVRK
jgi:peptidase M28-like protein